MVEITQTDWAVVLEHLSVSASLLVPASRVLVPTLDVSLTVLGLNPDLVSFLQLFQSILPLDLFVNSNLLSLMGFDVNLVDLRVSAG